jgi:hypothetical protein
MTKTLHGKVHGRIIEVPEDLGMLDGQTVDLIVTLSTPSELPLEGNRSQTSPKKLPGPPSGWMAGRASTSAGLRAEEWTEEDDRILEQVSAERKAARWRELPE